MPTAGSCPTTEIDQQQPRPERDEDPPEDELGDRQDVARPVQVEAHHDGGKMRYDKLIRDGVPALLSAQGVKFTAHTITSDAEFLEALGDKLVEEAGEFQVDPSLAELADVAAVVLALLATMGLTGEDLEDACEAKQKERGGFAERIILEETVDP